MMAEHAIDWTLEWKDLGRAEGKAEAVGELRKVARANLEARFGALPPEVGEKLAALDSIEELGRLIARAATAESLAALKLA